MSIVTRSPKDGLLFLVVMMFFISCGTGNKITTKQLKQHFTVMPVLPPPVFIIQHDTVQTKLSSDEYRAYLKQFYRDGFNELFVPEFKTLAHENLQLEKDIQVLSQANAQQVLDREDAMQRARNKIDNAEQNASYYRKEAKKAQDQLLEISHKDSIQFAQTLKANNDTVKILITLTLVILAAVGAMFLYVLNLGKKVKALQFQLAND